MYAMQQVAKDQEQLSRASFDFKSDLEVSLCLITVSLFTPTWIYARKKKKKKKKHVERALLIVGVEPQRRRVTL